MSAGSSPPSDATGPESTSPDPNGTEPVTVRVASAAPYDVVIGRGLLDELVAAVVATVVVETDQLTVDEVVAVIVEQLGLETARW